MVAVAKEDPTFSVFFSAKRKLLPQKLRAFLHMSRAMPEIYKVLPSYRDYAEGVLGGYEQTPQDIANHKQKLEEYDALIAWLNEPASK